MKFTSYSQAGQPRKAPVISKEGAASRHRGQLADIAERVATTPVPDGFLAIPGFSGRYSVSEIGQVFSHFHGRLMKQQVNAGGYFTVTLSLGSHETSRPYEVHALIMAAFVGPPNGLTVDHIDRNKANNILGNLRYATYSVNGQNSVKPKFGNKTKYRGIVQVHTGAWIAKINAHKIPRSSQCFQSEIEAARRYDAMAVAFFGVHAMTNRRLGLL